MSRSARAACANLPTHYAWTSATTILIVPAERGHSFATVADPCSFILDVVCARGYAVRFSTIRNLLRIISFRNLILNFNISQYSNFFVV